MRNSEKIECGPRTHGVTMVRRIRRIASGRTLKCIAMSAVLLTATYAASAQTGPGNGPAYQSLARRLPDANQQMAMRLQRAQQLNFEAANALRQKILVEEAVLMVKLATELKAETDKTSPDTLSLGALRKVEDIERLARDVKARMNIVRGGG
jgi:hypothetical protein